MNEVIEPGIAIAKVIAAGSAGDDWLRATILLTPSYPADSADSLARWPSQMINWLRHKKILRLQVQPVTYTGAEGNCAALPSNAIQPIDAEVAAMESTWGTGADAKWVDELWAEFFEAKKDPQTWATLARVIDFSSRGEALAPGGSGMKAEDGANPKIGVGEVRKTQVAANDKGATLEWILPSRQTELSLLLEYKRALELCDSAKYAHEPSEDVVSREIDCTKIARSASSGLADLFDAARKQYKQAHDHAESLYSQKPCGPLNVQASSASNPNWLGTAGREEIEHKLRDPLDSYQAANQPQHYEEKEGKENPYTPADKLSQVYYALQASPTLSRLFGLALDVRFRAEALRTMLQTQSELADGGHFLYLAMGDDSVCRNALSCRIYTLAKYRKDSLPQHFWPASRAEVGLGRTPDPQRLFELAQYDGVMVAGRRVDTPPSGSVGRFELSTLDVHSASEAMLDRRELILTDEELKHQCTSASPAQRPAAIARKTHLTAGLVILDRGRQQQAVAQFAARVAHQNHMAGSALVLDADDLTIGYRIDVGVPLRAAKPLYAWRGLMARNMKHGTSGGRHAQRLAAIARGLFLENAPGNSIDPDMSWRRCLEDGSLALPARLIPRAESVDAQVPVDAFVEEAIGTWTGEPMSVPCAGKRDEKVKLYGLPTGCVVTPPTRQRDSERRSPALRFGVPYRVGLRPVYPGGISVPLKVATNLYDSERTAHFPLGGSLTIPPVPPLPNTEEPQQVANVPPIRRRDQLRRFLRHERIDAPFLLLPEHLALYSNRPMEYERAAHAVIRTVRGRTRDRERPVGTQRVFVVPGVSQAFAAMHGVFDKTSEARPADGLASRRFGRYGVRFDAEGGGFPVVMSSYIVGFNGVPYVSSRRISEPGEKAEGGELVYAMAGSSIRKEHYYPDPAASAYVIGVRVAGSSEYLGGAPCIISAYGSGYRYPDARPLVLTIQRAPAKQRRSVAFSLEDVLSWPKLGSNSRVSGNAAGAVRIPGSVEALLSLAPGDDFEVDVWCVPESGDLAKRFAVIESVGALAIARARTNGNFSPPTRQQVCDVLKRMLPALVCEEVDKCLPDTGSADDPLRDWNEGCGGPGGLPAPGPESLVAIARALYAALIKRPLDEIAAVRTLRATHATDQPLSAPELVIESTDDPLPTLSRIPGLQDERNAYTVTGEVLIHLPTTGCIEIRADMASPSSDKLDDMRRGRSLRDRRFGIWPTLDNGSRASAERIFGFDVSATGDVSLPKIDVVLYRLDDIPLPVPEKKPATENPGPDNKNDSVDSILLHELFKLRGRDSKLGSGKPTFQFSDGLARLLCLRVTAYARHGDQMRTANAPAQNGKWLRDGHPLPPEASSTHSAYVPAWLLANVRPAEPVTRTPVPGFVWTTYPDEKRLGEITRRVKRRSVIRIPLVRPWFSSGEDERLGIVVWPPGLFTQDPDQLADDQVIVPPRPGQELGRLMNLKEFQDEDLGPGGKFITRWGGDPIREPAPAVSQRRTFIPAWAFVDAREDTGTGFKVELVSNVKMPVRITDDGAPDENDQANIPLTLEVSLLTYRPKFDVNEELWYVDLTLEHEREAEPFVRLGLVRYQPHAPARLQVSYPVTQWTQLLPRRLAQVTKSKCAVTIRVEGLATAPAPMDVKEDDASSIGERPSVSRMIVRIIREFSPERGIPTRRVITEAHLEPHIDDPETAEAYRAVWEKELPFTPDKAEDARERPKYFVILEEREARLPATYLNEPVSPEMAMGRKCDDGGLSDDVLVESGARFFARIELDA